MSQHKEKTRGRETAPLLPKPGSNFRKETGLNVRNLVVGNVVVCLYFIATNFHNPTMDQYLYRRMIEQVFGNVTHQESFNQTCYVNKTDKHYLLQEKAQQLASRKEMYFTMARGVFTVSNVVLLGAYSDFIGRKVMFLVAMTGNIIRYCTLSAVIYWELDFNYYFIGEIVSGITGYDYSFLLASYAYTADNTPPKKTRTIAIAVLETTLNLANAASQTASGFFIQRTGFLYPSITSAIVMFLAAMFVLVCVTETLPRVEVQQKDCIGPCKSIKRVVGFYLFDDTKQTRLLFILALLTYLFFILPSSGVSNTYTLYMLNEPFCWTPETIGYYSMAGTALKQLLGVPLIKVLQYCISDEIIGISSSVVMVAAYTLRGLAYTDWMMYGGLEAFTFAMSPTVRAIMSRMSPRDRQGSLFTSLMLVQSLCTLLGVPAFSSLYQATVQVMRGSVYLAMAGLQLLSVTVFIVFACRSRGYDHGIYNEEEVTIQESGSLPYSSPGLSASFERSGPTVQSRGDLISQPIRSSDRYMSSYSYSSVESY